MVLVKTLTIIVYYNTNSDKRFLKFLVMLVKHNMSKITLNVYVFFYQWFKIVWHKNFEKARYLQ